MISLSWGSNKPAQPTWTSTDVPSLLEEATKKMSTTTVSVCDNSFFQAFSNLAPSLKDRCGEIYRDETESDTDETLITALKELYEATIAKPVLTISPPSSVTATPLPSSPPATPPPSIEVVATHFVPDPNLPINHLRSLCLAISNDFSADVILTAVDRLDGEARERFLRHASENAGYSVTEDNLKDSQEALLWALSEETSRYVSLNYHFTQDEWNLLDYFIWEADGTQSTNPEFGKYHRMHGDLSNFLMQTQKVLNNRSY
jgi:hypothetical protein